MTDEKLTEDEPEQGDPAPTSSGDIEQVEDDPGEDSGPSDAELDIEQQPTTVVVDDPGLPDPPAPDGTVEL
jgi:hypothetical protein